IKNNFCLIAGLRCDKPYDLEVKPSNIWLLTKYFPQKFGFVGESIKGKGKSVKGKGKVKTAPKKATKKVSVTCVELERAFKECEDEDDVLNMGLVYFPEAVLIEVKSNVGEGDEERMVMWKKIRMMKRNNRGEVKRGRDPDGATKGLVMPFSLTPDTNDVEEFKVKIKEFKVVVGCLAHEKDTFSEKCIKEGLTKELKALRRVVKEEDEGKEGQSLKNSKMVSEGACYAKGATFKPINSGCVVKECWEQLENMMVGDTDIWRWPIDKEEWLSTNTCYQCDHTVRTAHRATRGRKPESSTSFLHVLLKTVKGKGEPFSTSWLVNVESMCMPLNLDNHWVAVEMNLKA
ncbi:hypothetical protein C1H46_003768, partial [Malus baccata]